MLSSLLKNPEQVKSDPSIWVLIVANLVPLAGVFFWDWSIFEVVLLYWMENVIIGIINILKMATCSPDLKNFDFDSMVQSRMRSHTGLTDDQKLKLEKAKEFMGKAGNVGGPLNHGMKFFLIPFFTIHYGMFCLVHGIFVVVLLGSESPLRGGGVGPGSGGFPDLLGAVISHGGSWAALALTFSHLFSFATNYIGKGEYKRTAVPFLMMAPYGRIVVLHVAILFGAFAIMALGSPIFLMILLICGKILLDLKLHIRAHQKAVSLVQEKSAEAPAS